MRKMVRLNALIIIVTLMLFNVSCNSLNIDVLTQSKETELVMDLSESVSDWSTWNQMNFKQPFEINSHAYLLISNDCDYRNPILLDVSLSDKKTSTIQLFKDEPMNDILAIIGTATLSTTWVTIENTVISALTSTSKTILSLFDAKDEGELISRIQLNFRVLSIFLNDDQLLILVEGNKIYSIKYPFSNTDNPTFVQDLNQSTILANCYLKDILNIDGDKILFSYYSKEYPYAEENKNGVLEFDIKTNQLKCKITNNTTKTSFIDFSYSHLGLIQKTYLPLKNIIEIKIYDPFLKSFNQFSIDLLKNNPGLYPFVLKQESDDVFLYWIKGNNLYRWKTPLS